MERKTQLNIWYLVMAVLGVILLQDLWQQAQHVQPIPYSEFERKLDRGEIERVTVGDIHIAGTFKTPQADGRTRFVTTRVEPDLPDRLARAGIEYAGAVESTFLRDLL